MSSQTNEIRKAGWVKKQTGRYLKEWRFRYALIEGHHLKSYKKANCKEETECVDLTQFDVSYDISNAKQFQLQSKKHNKTQFIFLCSNDSDANQWIKEIYSVQLMVEKQREKKDMERSESYNICLESISDLDREPLPSTIDDSISLPVITDVDIIEPNGDYHQNDVKEDVINGGEMYTNEGDILCKLDIMRMLIHNKQNKIGNEHLLNALKVLINDCYTERYKARDIFGSIRCDWHLLKLNHHQHVMVEYVKSEGTSVIKILHYVLFYSMIVIYKHCDDVKQINALQLLNKYVKLKHGDYTIWRTLMEQSFVSKKYLRFCSQALMLCKRLKKHKLYLYPSTMDGFDDENILSAPHVIVDNIWNSCKLKTTIQSTHKYYCTFPAVSTQNINIKTAENNDIEKVLLTKIYVAKN
eukprot:275874_1